MDRMCDVCNVWLAGWPVGLVVLSLARVARKRNYLEKLKLEFAPTCRAVVGILDRAPQPKPCVYAHAWLAVANVASGFRARIQTLSLG